MQWETLNKYKYCVGKVKTGNNKISKNQCKVESEMAKQLAVRLGHWTTYKKRDKNMQTEGSIQKNDYTV